MPLESEFDQFKVHLKPDRIQKVQKEWGGMPVYIPRQTKEEKARRNNEIREKYYGLGHTAHQLCVEYCLTDRTIYRILNERSD